MSFPLEEPVSQTDPTFRSRRLYSPLTAEEILRCLQADKGYSVTKLPTPRTIRNKFSKLGIRSERVKKCRPIKIVAETDAVFEHVHATKSVADRSLRSLRLSLDCKDVVEIGLFPRGGKNRIEQKAAEHDFSMDDTLVPFGIFLPRLNESHFWFSPGPVTADFMVDCIQELWSKLQKMFPKVNRLVLNADNGLESNGQRTQWLNRLTAFSYKAGITVELAYFPPYHSKYNPIERLRNVLGNRWRGELLSPIKKTLGLARAVMCAGVFPSTVELIRKKYRKGVRLTKRQMVRIENRIKRITGLEKWFIKISPRPQTGQFIFSKTLSRVADELEKAEFVASKLSFAGKSDLDKNPENYETVIGDNWRISALPEAWSSLLKHGPSTLFQLFRNNLPEKLDIKDNEILEFLQTLEPRGVVKPPSKTGLKERKHSFPRGNGGRSQLLNFHLK